MSLPNPRWRWRPSAVVLLLFAGTFGAMILAKVFNREISTYCLQLSTVHPEFALTLLEGTHLTAAPTSLQFGPDNRLYVSQQDGIIQIYTVRSNSDRHYEVGESETITLIQSIPNHDDDGRLNPAITWRLVTGLLVAGTADHPDVYVSSSDPRIKSAEIDTNSGVISRLTRDENGWNRQDLVRGLPRSRYDHAPNGLQLDAERSILYLAQGSNTNAGAPSERLLGLSEYALSGAILAIDLKRLPEPPYDLPTLDDEDRPGNPDENDPFGGDSGKNQAILAPGGPVQLFATGFRNVYDLVWADEGFYLVDNGPNQDYGGRPEFSAADGKVTNRVVDAGEGYPNSLHHAQKGGYYGHPNPTRANMENTFNEKIPQSPIGLENPMEAHFLAPGIENGALTTFPSSTNGITVYDFAEPGSTTGRTLLTVSMNARVDLTKLDSSGKHVEQQIQLLKGGGAIFLDVVALGEKDPFPGTIWIADWGLERILVLEPGAKFTVVTRLHRLLTQGQLSACETYFSGRQWVYDQFFSQP